MHKRITKKQYREATKSYDSAVKIIRQYIDQEQKDFKHLIKTNHVFKDSDLVYAAMSLCPCGHGMAYPKKCSKDHYWECSTILKGEGVGNKHAGKFSFAVYDIISENSPKANGMTTRGIYKPDIANDSEKTVQI